MARLTVQQAARRPGVYRFYRKDTKQPLTNSLLVSDGKRYWYSEDNRPEYRGSGGTDIATDSPGWNGSYEFERATNLKASAWGVKAGAGKPLLLVLDPSHGL